MAPVAIAIASEAIISTVLFEGPPGGSSIVDLGHPGWYSAWSSVTQTLLFPYVPSPTTWTADKTLEQWLASGSIEPTMNRQGCAEELSHSMKC